MATLGEDMVAEVAAWVAGAGGAGDFAGGASSSAWLLLSRFPGKHIHESANGDEELVGGVGRLLYIDRASGGLGSRETYCP